MPDRQSLERYFDEGAQAIVYRGDEKVAVYTWLPRAGGLVWQPIEVEETAARPGPVKTRSGTYSSARAPIAKVGA